MKLTPSVRKFAEDIQQWSVNNHRDLESMPEGSITSLAMMIRHLHASGPKENTMEVITRIGAYCVAIAKEVRPKPRRKKHLQELILRAASRRQVGPLVLCSRRRGKIYTSWVSSFESGKLGVPLFISADMTAQGSLRRLLNEIRRSSQ